MIAFIDDTTVHSKICKLLLMKENSYRSGDKAFLLTNIYRLLLFYWYDKTYNNLNDSEYQIFSYIFTILL